MLWGRLGFYVRCLIMDNKKNKSKKKKLEKEKNEIDEKFANMLWQIKRKMVIDDPNEYAEYLRILKEAGYTKDAALIFMNELLIIHRQPN